MDIIWTYFLIVNPLILFFIVDLNDKIKDLFNLIFIIVQWNLFFLAGLKSRIKSSYLHLGK